MNTKIICDRYNSYIPRKNNSFIISTAYEGIPQNVFINILAYIILIGLFLFLRKKAWNYGNLAWLSKPLNIEHVAPRKESRSEPSEAVCSDTNPISPRENINLSFKEKLLNVLPLFIKMSDENLKERCGSDAVIYCRFQRHLIIIVSVMMVLSLTIIVPLNLHGHLLTTNSSVFSSLTIANVPRESASLWAHFTVSLGFMLFVFFISTRFLSNIDVKTKEEPSFTIMINNASTEYCDEMTIEQHFREAYPLINPIKVQVTYEVATMISLYTAKVAAEEALQYCYEHLESHNQRIKVIPNLCGRICLSSECCQGKHCSPVDGIEFYTNEVIRLTNLFTNEKSYAITNKKLPIFFVTFENLEQALRVRKDYMYQNYACISNSRKGHSSLSKQLNSDNWTVKFAPMPKDILWQNLHKRGWKWWLPIIIMNMLVGILIIVLSTPAVALNIWNNLKFSEKLQKLNNPLVAQFAPSLVMVLVSAMMPLIIYWSDQLSGHWTKTTQNIAVMNKLFTVLVITVLILPSLGLNSIPQLVKWLFVTTDNSSTPNTIVWECIFMADGGALFCNYIITASFIGTALELLRLGELFMYTLKRSCSRSRAEDAAIIKSVLWDFQFGVGYAWTLALFTVVSAYSVIVPIITPFGLTYLLLKHTVDRYNMIHVNVPSIVHNSVHSNAAQLMQVGLVLTQATVTVYVSLRRGTTNYLSICCFLAFVLGLMLTFGRTLKRWIFSMSWIKYSNISNFPSNIVKTKSMDLENMDEDGFIMVDEIKNSVFVPPQMSNGIDISLLEKIKTARSSVTSLNDDNDTVPFHTRNYGATVPNLY